MREALGQILSYVWGVWRYRWVALAVAWLVAVAGWVYVSQIPESYVANARVFVDTNSVLRPLLRGLAITPNIDQRVSMMSRTLLSRPNLEDLARRADLDLGVTSEQQRADLVDRLRGSINLRGSRGNASIYSISVRDRDRATAKRITQALLTVFIENSINEKREDSTGAQGFLDEQIAEYERRLIEAENRLAVFKQQNVDVLPGAGGDYYSRLQQTRENLRSAQLALEEAQNRAAQLRGQLRGDEPMTNLGNITTPLDARIGTLQSRVDELLTRYTELHPEVRQLRGLISELQQQRDQDLADIRAAGGLGEGGGPVFESLMSLLAETEARVAELEVRVREYQARVDELNDRVLLIPEKEAELKQLDRDYGVLLKRQQELVQRRESARLSQDVEDNASDVSFRVIDPPFVPLQPSEPNKVLLNAGVLVLALGAGLGIAFLLSLLHPVVTDARALQLATGLPLLGVVTYNKKPEERRRDNLRLLGFAACSASLVLALGIVITAPALIP